MSRPPRVRPSRAKAASTSDSSTAFPPAVSSTAPSAELAASAALNDALLFNGVDTGTDSDRDEEAADRGRDRSGSRAGSGRERDRKRERERRRDRDGQTGAASSKPRADKLDYAAAAMTATAASATSAGGASTNGNPAKRKPPSTSSSSSTASAAASSSQSKPKQSSKQQQRAVSEADSPEGEVYCVCRLPNTGEAMICCEECDEWYHFRCIGMTAAEAARTEHYVCAACKEKAASKRSSSGGVKGESEGKKRRREEEAAGKATSARSNGLEAEAAEGKRSRRHRNGGVEEREEELGDGTGKWLRKDMVVESESDEEEWVYSTSDDDELPTHPMQQQPGTKVEQTNLKQEDETTLPTPSTSFTASAHVSFPTPRLPRISSPAVSFDRPDYRLHPLIHQTSPRAKRHARSSSPTRALVGSLALDCATAVRGVVNHRWLATVRETQHQYEGYALRQVQRCVQRWQAVLSEYEGEEARRQMQLAAEEWRWRRLIHRYLHRDLDSIAESEDGIRPPPTSFELLLSSALPVGLGHPRFVHDTQEVVNAAHEKSLQSDAVSSFQSVATTPASYAVPSVSTTSASTSRLTFHFHRVKRDAADAVELDTLWCVGCAGYVPVDDYAKHARDCCQTPATTPDQKLVVVVPYEQPMPEPMVVEMDAPTELGRLAVLGEAEDAEGAGRRKEAEEAADKADAEKWQLGDKPDASVLAMARFHQQLANRRALSLQFDARQHSRDPASRFPLREYLNKPLPEPKPAEPAAAKPAPPTASSQLPQPHLSTTPAPRLITRHQRFLNPDLFPALLCGYPFLASSGSAAGHFCAQLHSACSAHGGWEERWAEERSAARVKLEGRLRAVRADAEGLRRVLDVEEKERAAGKSALHVDSQAVSSALSAQLDAERAEGGANEASPAASELSDGSVASVEEETALEAHTLLRRPSTHRASSSSDASSDGDEAGDANGTAAGGEKKRTDRERLRERERINKQRQRERAKAREREKELRLREKERSREKKREKRKRKEKERERKERKRDKDRHGHRSGKKKSGSRSSGVRRRDDSSSSDRSSNSSDDRSDDSSRSSLSDGRDY